jgi:hypothetical protein
MRSSSLLALALVACGGASVHPATHAGPAAVAPAEPTPSISPAAYTPGGYGWFDVVARDAGVRLYGAIQLEDARVLARFDLDREGRPSRAAPIELVRGAPSGEVVVAAAAVSARDLVVLCDQAVDGATHYVGMWVDEAGTLLETIELGAFPAEDAVSASCFVAVAPSGVDRAVVLTGRDSLACPREASDDDIEQCPGYRAVTLAPGLPPEEQMRVGTLDALPRLVGTESGWAWGLGPYPFAASIVLSYASIPNAPHLLDAYELDGFLATPDTIAALARVERGRAPVAAAFRGEEVLTGAAANGYDELPVSPASRSLSCVDGALTATVTAGDVTIAVRAGADRTSVPWRLFLETGEPDGTPDPGAAAASGRVYVVVRDAGDLAVVSCEGGEVTRRDLVWRAD